MMSANVFFDYAQLAEAAYVDFASINGRYDDYSIKALLQSDSADGGFSEFQAEAFVNAWQVISHTKNTSNGFSATLFQHKETGNYVYTLRGTEPGNAWDDIVATDIADIVLDGLAIDQIVDMYNDWQYLNAEAGASYQVAQLSLLLGESAALAAARLTTPVGTSDYEQALRARSDIIIDMPTGMVYTIEFVDSQEYYDDHRAQGSGILHDQQVELDVTGHSLGGHLAAAFTRLFPETGAEATTINGAGFATELIEGLGGRAATNIANVFGMLGGASDFEASRIQNLYGSAGIDTNFQMVMFHGGQLSFWSRLSCVNTSGFTLGKSHQSVFV